MNSKSFSGSFSGRTAISSLSSCRSRETQTWTFPASQSSSRMNEKEVEGCYRDFGISIKYFIFFLPLKEILFGALLDINKILAKRKTKIEGKKKEQLRTQFVNGIEIIRESGLPTIIIDDRDPNFTLAIIPVLEMMSLSRLQEIKSPEIEPERNWADEPPVRDLVNEEYDEEET
jgi:hypothetical protein